MQTDFEQAVKMEVKRTSTFGSAPTSLTREGEAICTVSARRHNALLKSFNELESWHRGAVESLTAQIAELSQRIQTLEYRRPKPSLSYEEQPR